MAKKIVVEQVAKLSSQEFDEFDIQFMGGEPLLVFPLIRELSEWIWSQNWNIHLAQIFVPTNGTLLNEEMKSWFSIHKENICMGLSFDGDRLMQNINRSNSFSHVDLLYFAETWPEQSVKMTLSPDTIAYLHQGVKFLREMGLRYVAVDLAMGTSVKWEQQHLKVWAEQLRLLSDDYISYPDLPIVSILDIDVLRVFDNKSNPKKCGCGEQIVCVDTDGSEYACHLFAPITASPEKAKASQCICFTKHENFESANCKQCLLKSLCTTCCGMNFLTTGDVTLQSPFTCLAFKIQFLISCNMYYKIWHKKGDLVKAKKIEMIINKMELSKHNNYE